MVKYLEKAAIIVVAFLLIFLAYKQHEAMKSITTSVSLIEKQVKMNTQYMATIDSLIARKRDSVFFYTNTIKIIDKEKEQRNEIISNTTDIDSLINFYYKLRPIGF
jgi:hypothetical protein